MTADLAVRPNAPLAYPPGVTLETWADRGRELVEAHEQSRWQLAVWWEYGDRHYAEAIQVAEDLGVSAQYLHKASYIIRAVRNLLPAVQLEPTALPFWSWEPLAHKALEPDERTMLADKAITEKMPRTKIRALVDEYLKAKSLPEPQQPRFENGLAPGAQDDGLPLPPHGVTRGGDAPDAILHLRNGDQPDLPGASVTVPAVESGEAAGTPYEPTETDQEEAADAFWTMRLSPECRHQIDLLRRYYKQSDMTAAQVIERAIGQLCTIKKEWLARLA